MLSRPFRDVRRNADFEVKGAVGPEDASISRRAAPDSNSQERMLPST